MLNTATKIITCILILCLTSLCAAIREDGSIDLGRLATASWLMAQPDSKEQNVEDRTSSFGETFANVFVQLYNATKLAFMVVSFLKTNSMPRDLKLIETINLYYSLDKQI
jgi:hypothetical protein